MILRILFNFGCDAYWLKGKPKATLMLNRRGSGAKSYCQLDIPLDVSIGGLAPDRPLSDSEALFLRLRWTNLHFHEHILVHVRIV